MNIGQFLYNIGEWALSLANRLYEAFFMEIDIKWIKTVLDFFGASVDMPDKISMSYIFGGASALLLLTFIIYRLVK